MSRNLSLPQICLTRNERSLRLFQFFIAPAPLLLSTAGTFFVLSVLIAQRQRTKILAPTNVALCALLASDLLFLATGLASLALYMAGERSLRDMVKEVSVWGLLRILPGYVQCVVSLERLVAVMRPLQLRTLVTRRRMVATLVGVGVLVLGVQAGFTACLLTAACSIRSYSYHLLVLYCGVPLVCLCACSILIICVLARKRTAGVATQADANSTRLAVILVVIDLLYLLTSLPYTLFWILHPLVTASSFCFDFLISAVFLTHLSPMTDWIVLLCLGSQIRRAAVSCLTPTSSRSSA